MKTITKQTLINNTLSSLKQEIEEYIQKRDYGIDVSNSTWISLFGILEHDYSSKDFEVKSFLLEDHYKYLVVKYVHNFLWDHKLIKDVLSLEDKEAGVKLIDYTK